MTNKARRLWRYLLCNGIRGTLRLIRDEIKYHVLALNSRRAEPYHNPTDSELAEIEAELRTSDVQIEDLSLSTEEFLKFMQNYPFPDDYHGGRETGYWHEKLFEHFVSAKQLALGSFGKADVFVDVAAGGSPWALMLRGQGVHAYALDLEVREAFTSCDYYLRQDATKTDFADNSVKGLALHCAFEMFVGDADTRAIAEFSRILKPGGKAIIVPLYMHTHDCTYSSPEFWGRGYGDPGSREYVRRNSRNIPCSRKYSVKTLYSRVLDPASRLGLKPRLFVVRNKCELSHEIYCHFVLELQK